jgi:hypothetical protein
MRIYSAATTVYAFFNARHGLKPFQGDQGSDSEREFSIRLACIREDRLVADVQCRARILRDAKTDGSGGTDAADVRRTENRLSRDLFRPHALQYRLRRDLYAGCPRHALPVR